MEEKDIFLAFDYGTINIGVAVGQKITKSATALPPLVAKNLIPPWHKIDILVKNWHPHGLVVGVPYQLDGGELRVTKLAQKFMQELKARYNIPVYSAEERFTTKAAREEIFKRGGYRALQNVSVDSEAAKIILEEWIRN